MRLSSNDSCPVCFHVIFVSFTKSLIFLYYTNLMYFFVFIRTKVSYILSSIGTLFAAT